MNNRALAQVGALGLAVATVACGRPEQRVVDQYFNAVNAQDNQTLSSFSAVKFDTTQKVQRWSIVSVTPEAKGPAALADLVKKVKDTERDIADNKKAAGAYVLQHPNEVDQVRELAKKDAKVPAKLQPIAAEWDKFNQKDRELKKALAEAKDAADKERRDVVLSVGDVPDLDNMAGDVLSKEIELQLTIGGTQKAYGMGLKKYDLQSGKTRVLSRWVVHKLDPK